MANPKKMVIKITKGKEYSAKIDKAYQSELLFSKEYRQARDCVFEIIQMNRLWEEGKKNSDIFCSRPNNVITFCADRGQGKTTALLSFCRELSLCQEKEGNDKDTNERKLFWKANMTIPRFSVLETPIDPAALSEKGEDSIIRIILSRLYKKFEERLESESGYSSENERKIEKLIKLFKRCARCIDVQYKGYSSYENKMMDELDKLGHLGDSGNLRNELEKLVNEYLSYMYPKEKNCCLIIPIDDSDTNAKLVYEILEDIRKYLILPNVIIVMACHMRQLESIVEQYFLTTYQDSLRFPEAMVTVEQCHEAASLYLEKVIPNTHRIFLPDINSCWENLVVRYKDPVQKNSDQTQTNNLLYEDDTAKLPVQLLRMLHKKTGLIYSEPKNFLHNLLPRNMRELTHFLAYFSNMDDLTFERDSRSISGYEWLLDRMMQRDIGEERNHLLLEKWKHNLDLMEIYLVEHWAAARLREKGRTLLKELSQEPIGLKHTFVLRSLPDYYAHEQAIHQEKYTAAHGGNLSQNLKEMREEYIKACKERNVVIPEINKQQANTFYSCTYADAMTAISVLLDIPHSARQYVFAYGIRFYYTILLNRMLLTQVERNEYPVPEKETIPAFLGDVLFRTDVDERSWFYYLRITVGYSCLKDKIEKDNYSSYVDRYFRLRVLNKGELTTAPIRCAAAEKQKESSHLIFNAFYPLMNILDRFSRLSEMDKDKLKQDTDFMLLSMVLLLNWDMQFELLHVSRQIDISDLNDKVVTEYVDDFWNSESIKQLLEKMANCNLDYAGYVNTIIKANGEKKFLTEASPNITANDKFIQAVRGYLESCERDQDKIKNLISHHEKASLKFKHKQEIIPFVENIEQINSIVDQYNKTADEKLETNKKISEITAWPDGLDTQIEELRTELRKLPNHAFVLSNTKFKELSEKSKSPAGISDYSIQEINEIVLNVLNSVIQE